MKFEERKVGTPTKRKNAQEHSTFCHTISPSGAYFKKYLDEQMAFNTESAFAERNIQRASHYLLQKRKIAQSLTRSIQTLKAKNTHHMSHASLSQFFNFQDFNRKRLRGSQELVFMPVVAPCL